MGLTYLDQTALIALGRKARQADFRAKLDAQLSSSLTVVLSSWHLVETSRTKNLANGIELATFIDSLKPVWLHELFTLRKMDVEDDFDRFLKIEVPMGDRVTTKSAVFAELNGSPDSSRFDISSVDFVRQWVQNPDQLRPIDETYAQNARNLIGLREHKKAGRLTEEIEKRVNEVLAKTFMPKTTPTGLHFGRDLTIDYVKQFNPDKIPTVAIETAISEHEWGDKGGLDGNTMLDKIHLISALPLADEIVSNDQRFHDLYPIAKKTGHVKAVLLREAEFLARIESEQK
jgi:hypothetical protein